MKVDETSKSRIKINKDKNYGKPKEGSAAADRAAKAKLWVQKEVKKLLHVIVTTGSVNDDGLPCVAFGPLFVTYQDISDTLVGMLMRGKKFKYLEYKGDMLFQGSHDKVMITLTPKGVQREKEPDE